MYARVPDFYGIVAQEAPAVIADPQKAGVFRYAGCEPTGGLVKSPSVKPPWPVLIGIAGRSI
jgi:hypothetical protein